jgi:hypothetical protein
VAHDAAARAYMAGIDEIPWHARIARNGDTLTIERAESDSGNFYFPYRVEGHGELVLATGSLMERSEPYHLQVELARGTLNRLRNQVAGWEAMGMATSPQLAARVSEALGHLSRATTSRADAAEAADQAELALRAALDGVALLNEAYVSQALAARHQQAGKVGTVVGVNLGGTLPGEEMTRQLVAAFNTVQVPLVWRDLAAREGTYDWSLADRQIEWARSLGLKVVAGPLVSIDRWSLPDWMYLWGEDDVESFRSCVSEHVQAVVSRYRGRVHLWVCASRLNVANELDHAEDERLRLAVMAIDAVRRVDARSPIVLSIDQPWGAFMSREPCDLSPLHFADALVRADLGLAGIGLEINFGYQPHGSEPRDPLEFGRQLDRFSTLGLPLLVSPVVPSAGGADPTARRQDVPLRYPAGGEPSDATQRAWAETYLPVMLAKQAVQAVIWNQLADSDPHPLAHGGLFDADGRAKPIVEYLQAVRREHLG